MYWWKEINGKSDERWDSSLKVPPYELYIIFKEERGDSEAFWEWWGLWRAGYSIPEQALKKFVVWMGRHQDIAFTENNDPSHHIKPIFHGKTVFLDLSFLYQPQSPVVWLRWSKLRNRGVVWGWRSPCRLWSLCWINGRAVSKIWVGVLGPSSGRAGEGGFKEMVS